MLFTLVIIGTLILMYDLYISISIQQEENKRLSDPELRSVLSEIFILGDSEQPATLLLHGFGGSPYDMKPLSDALSEQGRTVLVPCIAGHCEKSPRELAKSDPIQWISSAEYALERLTSAGYKQIDVVGFSLGGILATVLAKNSNVRKVVLISPYTEVPYKWYYIIPVRTWKKVLGTVVPYIKKLSSGQINDLSGRESYEPSYLHLSTKSMNDLDGFSDSFWKDNKVIKNPILFIYSTDDNVSSPDKMKKQAKLISKHINILRVSKSAHIILHDKDKKNVINSILDFLNLNK